MSSPRCFLFLQGVCSPFFSRLADRLQAAGHRVLKLNFNGGDRFYWGARPAKSFRGRTAELPQVLAELYDSAGVTDQMVFGDCRPVHRPAILLARDRGIVSHVFEEGYFRPYWLTLEREGVNGYSQLPRDPAWYLSVGKSLPEYGNGRPFASPFRVRAAHDVLYHLAGLCNPLLYPGYRTHAPTTAPVEYYGYIKRLPMLRFHAKRDSTLIADLIGSATPFFLLPLQLGGDAQITTHSRFRDMHEVIARVMTSFAGKAPADSWLVIKNHPLDPGLENYRRTIRRLAMDLDLERRMLYLETGDLLALLEHARGTVTVNSTVGAAAIAHNCPTLTLGDPIYNMPGLTQRGDLDGFWRQQDPPDMVLYRHFRNTVIHCTQVNGGLHSSSGIALAVANCLPVLLRKRSILEELL